MESINQIIQKLESIVQLNEQELTKAHVEHPEDLLFQSGSKGAETGLRAIVDTVRNPGVITIKWDGYPALVFGRGKTSGNRFIVADKHMFNKSDSSGRMVDSPLAFASYDEQRGIERDGLHTAIANIWEGLEQSYSGNGYYWGDLLFYQPLQEKNGLFTFRPNPKGITYTVEVNSEVGQLLQGKQGGIAVHQYIPSNADNVQYAQTLNGSIGSLKNNSNVAIVPAKMPTTPQLNLDKNNDVDPVQAVISKNSRMIDDLLMNAPPGTKGQFPVMFTVYINKKIVAGNLDNLVQDFYTFAQERKMSESERAKLIGYKTVDPNTSKEVTVSGYLYQKQREVTAAFETWIAIYNLKMKVVPQLDSAAKDSPVKGYLEDGTQTQEGFVSHGIKLVNRMGFSRQNLAGR